MSKDSRTTFALKAFTCLLVLGSLAIFIGSQVLPNVSAWKFATGALAIAVGFFCIVLVQAYVVGQFKELLLRCGAIDTQWLWTPDYPEGFKRIWRSRSGQKVARPPDYK